MLYCLFDDTWDVIIVRTRQQLTKHTDLTQINVIGVQVTVSDSTRMFSVTIDKYLTFHDLCAKTHAIMYERYVTFMLIIKYIYFSFLVYYTMNVRELGYNILTDQLLVFLVGLSSNHSMEVTNKIAAMELRSSKRV